MAVISPTGAQVYIISNSSDLGVGERILVLRIRNVTTADTIDVGTWFSKVKSATFLPSGVLATIGVATPAGTVLTLTLASVANDTIILTVIGESAP